MPAEQSKPGVPDKPGVYKKPGVPDPQDGGDVTPTPAGSDSGSEHAHAAFESLGDSATNSDFRTSFDSTSNSGEYGNDVDDKNVAPARRHGAAVTREGIRNALRRGFYVFGALFGAGLFLSLASLINGNLIGLVSGAIVMIVGWVARMMLRILGELLAANLAVLAGQSRLKIASDRLERQIAAWQQKLHQRAGTNAPSHARRRTRKQQAERVAMLDLATLGQGDPDALAAARLDQNVFPRLARTFDEEETIARGSEDASRVGHAGDDKVEVSEGVTSRNIFREWQAAVDAEDLPACRVMHATLSQALESNMLAPLSRQLSELECQVEQSCRKRFINALRAGDYAAALHEGEEILRLFPERRIAEDFRRLRNSVERRVV